jgi:hypothetical protein
LKVNYLSIIGGLTIKEATYGMMGALIDNSLAVKMNWQGSNKKMGFSSLKLKAVVAGWE